MAEVIGDIARLYREHGIELPDLASVALGFPATGEDALAWWRRLHAVGGNTGHWPLLLDSALAGFLDPPVTDALAQVDELDGGEVLARLGGGLPGPDEQEELLAAWPDEPHREDAFRVPFTLSGEPAPVLVALVAAAGGWQLPAVLGYAAGEAFPPPAEHSAILRHWHERYGAELVCMTATNVELAIARPPRTRLDALAFAWEYAGYCPDGVDAVYRADTVTELAASLVDADVVVAWWD